MARKKTLHYMVASIILLMATFPVNGQQAFRVNLETVLQQAGADNLTIQEYQLKYQEALADRTRAKEWWLPDIYAGAATHYLAGAAMNTDGKILTNLTRNNLWTGLGVAAEIDFNRGKYRLLAAKQQAASLQYQSAAERNKAILSAVQAYFDLQVDQLKYLFLQTLADQADTLSRQIKVKVDAGLLYQSDYLLSQSNYNHLEISMMQAKTEWQKKSALLSNLLNLGNNIHLISADTSLIPLTLVAPPADSSGFEKRPEYLELGAELQSLQTLRKTTKEGLFLPKFRIGMDNGAFGAYTGPVQNTYQVNAAILWTIPIGRLAYKGDLKQWNAKIALQRNKEEQFKNQFRQEVSSATAELQTANEQIRIARLALASSSGALRQGIDREKLGTAKAFEVFQAQQLFLQAQMDYLQAVSEYNKAQYALKVAIGEML